VLRALSAILVRRKRWAYIHTGLEKKMATNRDIDRARETRRIAGLDLLDET
jgi:hypothetical protein